MFRQDFKNNLKNKIIHNSKFINNIFNFIEVIIDLKNKDNNSKTAIFLLK